SLFSLHDTATPALYTLSLHDALPIWVHRRTTRDLNLGVRCALTINDFFAITGLCYGHRSRLSTKMRFRTVSLVGTVSSSCDDVRSEEHTSELQSRENLVCRLLLEKKK